MLRREDGFWPWLPAEPNGGTREDCACVVAGLAGWNDYVCSEKARGFCHILPRPRFILRGGWVSRIATKIQVTIIV